MDINSQALVSHSRYIISDKILYPQKTETKKLNLTNFINYQKRRPQRQDGEVELKQKSITASFRLPIPITSTGSELLATEAERNSVCGDARRNAAEKTFPRRR
jgi:hypothetical protein